MALFLLTLFRGVCISTLAVRNNVADCPSRADEERCTSIDPLLDSTEVNLEPPEQQAGYLKVGVVESVSAFCNLK